MTDMISLLATFLSFACKDLNSLNSIDSFKTFIKEFYFDSEVISSFEFADLPTENTVAEKRKNIFWAQLYFFSIKLQKRMYNNELPNPLNTRILYINTINGSWVAVDLKNETATNEIAGLCRGCGQLTKLDQGYFTKFDFEIIGNQ